MFECRTSVFSIPNKYLFDYYYYYLFIWCVSLSRAVVINRKLNFEIFKNMLAVLAMTTFSYWHMLSNANAHLTECRIRIVLHINETIAGTHALFNWCERDNSMWWCYFIVCWMTFSPFSLVWANPNALITMCIIIWLLFIDSFEYKNNKKLKFNHIHYFFFIFFIFFTSFRSRQLDLMMRQ